MKNLLWVCALILMSQASAFAQSTEDINQRIPERAAAEKTRLSAAGASSTIAPKRDSTDLLPKAPAIHFANFVAASELGTAKDLEYMVRNGASVNERFGGLTPLVSAVRASNYANVEFLLGAGADANAVDTYGQSPLFHANSRSDGRMSNLLKAYGAKK